MPYLKLSFKAQNKVADVILSTTLKIPFELAIVQQNKKNKKVQGSAKWYKPTSKQKYSRMDIILVGDSHEIDKEEAELLGFLYGTISSYSNTDSRRQKTIKAIAKKLKKDSFTKIKTLVREGFYKIGIVVEHTKG